MLMKYNIKSESIIEEKINLKSEVEKKDEEIYFYFFWLYFFMLFY